MNEVVGEGRLSAMPAVLVERSEAVSDLVSQLGCEEVIALFSNPKIDEGFLREFLEQGLPWRVWDEPRRLAAVAALSRNGRMVEEYDGPMDGYAEYSHDSVFDAAWTLASKVPTTLKWAAHLSALYENTKPWASSLKEPLHTAARWVPDPSNSDSVEREQERLAKGRLGPFAEVRKQIARLAVRNANSSTKGHREQLHAMAWSPDRDPKNYLDPQNMYNARLAFYREKHPGWFLDESAPIDSDAPASDDAPQPMSSLQESVVLNIRLARETQAMTARLLTRTAWLAAGVGVAVVLMLLRLI